MAIAGGLGTFFILYGQLNRYWGAFMHGALQSVVMLDVAAQVRATTEEQARGSGRIRESIEGVRDAVEQIHAAVQEQSNSCRSAAEFLEVMHTRTRSNEVWSRRSTRC